MTATDKLMDSNLIYLLPGRFGPATMFEAPPDGFVPLAAGTTEAMYRPGTVCQVYNSGSYGVEGFSELIYLQADDGDSFTSAAKMVAIPRSNTDWFLFTCDPDDGTTDNEGNPHAVVCLSAVADTNFAWYWSGGVCPEQHVPDLAGNFQTNGSVDNTTDLNIASYDLSDNLMGFGAGDGATEAHIGCVLAIEVS